MPDLSLVQMLKLFTPCDIAGAEKIRVGADGDGGYVMLDLLSPPQKVFSYGAGHDISFDMELAARGHGVLLFDHTVDAPSDRHERIRFIREGVAGESQPERQLHSLADHVNRFVPSCLDDDIGLILKMDVEGAEWETLAAVPAEVLERFHQIVIEVHGLQYAADPGMRERIGAVMRKLRAQFTIFHAHANNAVPLEVVEGLTVAPLLELSLVRSDLVRSVPLQTVFPTPLDRCNIAERHETLLWFYPFFPGTAEREPALSDVLRRTALQHTVHHRERERDETRYALAQARAEVAQLRHEAAALNEARRHNAARKAAE